MEVIRTIKELRERLEREPQVACVPTMGSIHDGHLRLVRIARQHVSFVVTTIFVNCLQFVQGEDFDKYPRTFQDDCDKLDANGCSLVFHPDEKEMYPEPQEYMVDPPAIANKLEASANTIVLFGPRASSAIATWQAGMLGRYLSIHKG